MASTLAKLGVKGSGWPATLVFMCACACGTGKVVQSVPVPSLGQSIDAQRQFKALEQAWLEGNDKDRRGLEPRFTRYIQTYPADPESHLVAVWLAHLRIEEGKLDDAWLLSELASVDRVGPSFDAAQVVKAAVFSRRGQPERSMAILEPLSGKILDSRERDAWAREIVRAALQLKHDDDALKWALVWRLESSEDRRASIDQEIGLVLDQVSEAALDRLWNQLIAAEQLPTTIQSRRQGRVWMRDAVLQRLAKSAIHRKDGNLARRLLDDAWLSLEKSGDVRRLTRVAAQGEVEVRSLAKSIGVILELEDAESRRRSSELVTGILHTLDENGGHLSVRLLTAEAHPDGPQSYAEAVEDLCNEGATILVGGFGSPSAIELVNKASAKGVAAVALSEFQPANELTFSIDTSDRSVIDIWPKVEPKSAESPRIIDDSDTQCANTSTDAIAQWHPDGPDPILVNASATCSEALGQSITNGTRLPSIWLGPKALNAADAWPRGAIRGQFNFGRLLSNKDCPRDLAEWQRRFARLPSYYEVLGHDIAILGVASLADFSVTGTDTGSRSKALRDVAIRLSAAQGSLWSTTAGGFGKNHTLSPEFQAQFGAPSETAAVTTNKDGSPRK